VTANTVTIAPARPQRRGTELVLLLFAVLVATGALSAVVLAHDNRITATVGYLSGGFLAVYLLAHVAVRKLAPAADPLLLPIMALLNGLGLAMIYRLDLAYADRARRLGKPVPSGRAELQLAYSFVAVLILIAVLVIIRDHRTLARYTYTSAFVGLGLLAILVFAPQQNGARIALPVANIQPGEFSKILLMIFFAGYLVRKREVLSVVTRSFLGLPLPRARDLGPLLLAWLASILILVVIKDLGTSLLFFGIFLAVLYVATERFSWVVIGLLLFAGSAVFSYYAFGHVRLRVDIWLHPFKPSLVNGDSYQLVQGLFGLANGGLFGTGLGRGQPDVVPAAWNDFILSSLGEEIGAVGIMAILVLYFLLVARGLRAALGVRDGFGKLLAAGIGTALAIQVFVVAGGVLRVIPLTGLTLPFVAYGGSSLLANAILIALLLRISDAGRRPPPAPSDAVPLYDPAAVTDSPTQAITVRGDG
jgi:cell division protein FtsW (lipid II flippase)